MGFTYFKNKLWEDITREERYFCSILFHHFKGKENQFIQFLNEKDCEKQLNFNEYELEEDYKWEISFEVCFYRDYYKFIGKCNNISPKRTFDLCLFSENRIIIIEAKSHEGFANEQLNHIQEDISKLKTVLNKQEDKKFNVNTVALCSSEYINNCKSSTKEKFDLMISWKDISAYTNNEILKRANEIYSN